MIYIYIKKKSKRTSELDSVKHNVSQWLDANVIIAERIEISLVLRTESDDV